VTEEPVQASQEVSIVIVPHDVGTTGSLWVARLVPLGLHVLLGRLGGGETFVAPRAPVWAVSGGLDMLRERCLGAEALVALRTRCAQVNDAATPRDAEAV
jgi:hypothetical protein